MLEALKIIVANKGAVVPNLGDRKGKRQILASAALDTDGRKSSRGGARVKNVDSSTYQFQGGLHPHAEEAAEARIEASKRAHQAGVCIIEAIACICYVLCVICVLSTIYYV